MQFNEVILTKFEYKKTLIYFFIIFIIFLIDRISKIYLLNISESGVEIDFYILPFLNIYLVWNTGIGFGLLSFDANIFYHIITFLIIIINLVIIYLLFILKDIRKYFFLAILGGSAGNLFDRIYYYAVPDFIDLHIGNFHWFIFNIADIFISLGVLCLVFYEIFFKRSTNNE